MTDRDRDAKLLRSWLVDEGVVPLPAHVAEAVLRRLGTTRQRRSSAWRATRPVYGRVLALAAAAVVAVLLVGLALVPPSQVGPEPSVRGPSASPAASFGGPSATPDATPGAPPPPGVTWKRLATIESGAVAGGGPFRAVGFAGGYVVADGTGTIQFSPDGVEWEPVELNVADGSALSVTSAASDGTSVILGGEQTPCSAAAWERNPFFDCRARPASWISADGRTWRASGAWTGPLGDEGFAGSQFSEIWSVRDVGWEAAQVFSGMDESDDGSPSGPAMWRSEDGVTWSLLAERIPEFDSRCEDWSATGFRVLVDAAANRIASAGCGDGYVLLQSRDGVVYEVLDTLPPEAGTLVRPAVAATDASAWLFAGQTVDRAPLLWSSADLERWTHIELPLPPQAGFGGVLAVSVADVGYVAVGSGAISDTEDLVTTWVGGDLGGWGVADVQPPTDLQIDAIVQGPDGTLGIGSIALSEDTFELGVWRLEQKP